MRGNVKNSMKAGLLFGVSMGIFFGLINSVAEGIMFGVIWGLISGGITGFIFGLVIFIFIYFQSKKFKHVKEKISQDENVIFDGGANHFKGREAVGGWLFLTEKALKFISHKYNIQSHTIEIPINDIKTVVVTRTLKLIRNGLIVETVHNKKEQFVVNLPDVWIKHINANREEIKDG